MADSALATAQILVQIALVAAAAVVVAAVVVVVELKALTAEVLELVAAVMY